jgi:hypothetical protein
MKLMIFLNLKEIAQEKVVKLNLESFPSMNFGHFRLKQKKVMPEQNI